MTMTTPSTTNFYDDIQPMLDELRALTRPAFAASDWERIATIRRLLASWIDNLRQCGECGVVIEGDLHEQSACTVRPGDDRDLDA